MHRLLTFFVFLLPLALPVGGAPAEPAGRVDAVSRSKARSATAEELVLLSESLHKVADDYWRWAYTEHRVMRDDKGRVKSDVLLRYDPSKPYAEQWTPISINGKEPSERDRTKYRRLGERQAPDQLARADGPDPDQRRRRSLGELIEVDRSSIADETATHLIFDVALMKFGNERFPPEKFQVFARVRKEDRALETISVRLRDSFRAKLLIKVKSGEGTLEFSPVDPKHPPTLVAVSGDARASILFVNIGGALALSRTDHRHVKPYDERFNVQIGTLKAIDF